MRNWKAFDSCRIDFLDGVNFLIGPNAVGKTSMLEAICFAFTGEALTVDDPKKLVKEGKSTPAKITVEFLHNLKNYKIESSLSKKRRLNSRIFSDGELITEGFSNVSKCVQDLIGIDKRFFERVLYMSEGDVFRFIAYPPKEGIMAQIEDALGIDRMENLLSEVRREIEYYREKEEKNRASIKWFKELLPKERQGLLTLREKKKKAETMMEDLMEKSDDLATSLSKSKSEMNRLEIIILKIDQIEKEIMNLVKIPRLKEGFLQEIRRVQRNFRDILQKLVDDRRPMIERRGAINGRIESINKVLDLLSSVEFKKEHIVQCPVCTKPLSSEEIKELRKRFRAQKQAVTETLLVLNQKLNELEKELEDVKKNAEKLAAAETRMETIYHELETETLTNRDLRLRMEEVEKQLSFIESEKIRTKKEYEKTESNLRELDHGIRLEMLTEAPGRKADIETALVSSSKALIGLEMLEKATRATIRKERQNKLGPIYKEIANVWRKMKKDKEYRIEFDDKTVPLLFRDGQKFEMSQLSGGEKTVMLVIVRTVLCRRFTEIGFMLLDEPLEHLDFKNRGLLVDFLVESFDKGWVDQLIVTTFEESNIRKFHEHEKVNIIAL